MNKLSLLVITGLFLSNSLTFSDDSEFAQILSRDGDHAGAAVEFRRLALSSNEAESRSGYFWASAYEYWKTEQFNITSKMLDAAENASDKAKTPGLLLRAESTRSEKKWPESAFYFKSLLGADTSSDMKTYASRGLAESSLRQNDLPSTREALALSPADQAKAVQALDNYEAGRDKKPALGGLLGLVPGLGYAYAGEYANALRSVILNSLFIFGMATTANDEQWGGFAVITFFEFTWYSGSLYGGIDASHRYNQRRLDDCVRDINGEASFSPDYERMPEVALKFTF
ncbi:MAG: hypothetical protein V1913_09265 [Fibrobacterota bacterium]